MAGGFVTSSAPSSLAGQPIPNSSYNYIVAFASALGGFLFGYEIGIVDAILRMDDFGLTFGIKEYDGYGNLVETSLAASVKGWITFTFLVGCALGCLLVAFLTDKFGRKLSILLGGALFTIGGVMQAIAENEVALYGGRCVSGVGIGILSSVVPIYISETAPTQIRGRMITVQQLMVTIGILVASIVNSIIVGVTEGATQWHLALAIQCVPGALLVLIMFFMPNSPRWLLDQGKDSAALTVLAKLRASPQQSAIVQTEYQDIKNGIIAERAIGNADWSELLSRGIFNRLALAILLQTFQQWTGINIILYYAGDLFARMGAENAGHSSAFVIANAFVNFIATFPGMYLIERTGRKKLLVVGGFAMGLSHIAVTIFTGLSKSQPIFAWFAIFSVYAFMLFFSATWGPIVWVYQAEIFPLRVRGKAIGAATLANWTWNAIIAKVTPLIIERIDYYTYLIFGTMGLLMAIFTIKYVPETKGKSLEEMNELFAQKNDLPKHNVVKT